MFFDVALNVIACVGGVVLFCVVLWDLLCEVCK